MGSLQAGCWGWCTGLGRWRGLCDNAVDHIKMDTGRITGKKGLSLSCFCHGNFGLCLRIMRGGSRFFIPAGKYCSLTNEGNGHAAGEEAGIRDQQQLNLWSGRT